MTGENPISPSGTGESAAAWEPADAEDREWVLAFQSGREAGFNRLVLRHQDRIFGLCLRLLAGNRAEAEDAAQETFVKAFHGLPDFRLESKFSSWLYRIAVNACKNRQASRQYREARRHADLDAADAEGAASPSSPAQELEAKDRRERIEEAVARLPEDQRLLVVLRDIEGRSYEEIASATGLNPGTLKSRLNRGRLQLQAWLRESG